MSIFRFMPTPYLGAVLLASLAACSGQSADDLRRLAQEAVQGQQWRTAEIHIKNLLIQEREDANARLMLARIYSMRRDWPSAQKEYSRALEAGASVDDVAPGLLEAMSYAEDPGTILSTAKSLKTDSQTVLAQIAYRKAQAYLKQDDRENAEKHLARALELMPGMTDARVVQLAIAADESPKSVEPALTELTKLLDRNPEAVSAWVLKADFLARLNRIPEALSAIREANRLVPNQPAMLSRQATFEMATRDNESAWETVTTGLKLAPAAPGLLAQKASLLLQREKHADAHEAAILALRGDPRSALATAVAGHTALLRGAFEQAETYGERLVEMRPNAAEGYRLLAATYLKKGNSDKALAMAQELERRGHNDPAILALAGEAALRGRDAGSARQLFERSVSLDKDDPNKLLGLAMAKIALGDKEGGLIDLSEAASMNQDEIRADALLIMSYVRSREFNKAESAIAQMANKQPNSPLVDYFHGMVKFHQSQLGEARQRLEQAVKREPRLFAATALLTQIDLNEGKRDAARARLEKAARANPNNVKIPVALARVLMQREETKAEAIVVLEQGLTSNPNSELLLLALASAHASLGATDKAIEQLRGGVTRHPNSSKVLEALAKAQQLAGRKEQALQTSERLAKQNPNDATTQIRVASMQAMLGDTGAAMTSLQRAQRLRPDMIEPRLAQTALMARMKRLDDAKNLSADTLKDFPHHPGAWSLDGDIQGAQKNWKAAIDSYKKAVDLAPQERQFFFKLYRAMRNGKQAEQADKMLSRAIADSPTDPRLRIFAGDNAIATGRYQHARGHYEGALKLQPENAVIWNNLAWVMHKLKDPKALQIAERAYEMSSSSAAVMDTLASILLDNGSTDRALALFKAATERSPDSVVIRLKYARALDVSGDSAAARAQFNKIVSAHPKSPQGAEASKWLEENRAKN